MKEIPKQHTRKILYSFFEAGDIISMACGIVYSDPVGETVTGANKNRSIAKYPITTNSDASISGRYMGNF